MAQANKTVEEVYGELDEGQRLAVFHKVVRSVIGNELSPEQVVWGVLRDNLKLTAQDATIKLADHTGRLIPISVKSKVVDEDSSFHFIQPAKIDYADRLARLAEHFGRADLGVSVNEFEERSNALLEMVNANKQLANLNKRTALPIVIPQHLVSELGTDLESTFLAAAERAYKQQFPERAFNNYRTGELAGKVSFVEESRYALFLKAMAERPFVGIFYANPMQGYSIPAAREEIVTLPQGFILSGAVDWSVVMTVYTDVLARDWKTPGMDCAANIWGAPAYSLHFGAHDDKLVFGSGHLRAGGRYSAGLLFLG